MEVHSVPFLQPVFPLTESKRVMIIDDCHELRASIRDFLMVHGWQVEEMPNVQEALKSLKHRVLQPDVILLDYMMPLENGIYFWNVLNDDLDLCHIPTIMITGHDMNSINAIGIRAVLKKPIDTDRLLNLMNTLRNERIYDLSRPLNLN